MRYEKVIPFSYDGGGKTDENLPPYYNYKTEDSGNTIAFSFSVRAGNEPYYDVKYEWTFRGCWKSVLKMWSNCGQIWGMSRAIEILEAHQSPTPSRWREDAQWRRDNEYWLKYARHITLQVLRAMEEQSITQVELAKQMGCTQQYVSNLLKGSSNMTLETIASLENALSIDLVKSALTYVSGYGSSVTSRPQYLSDSAGETLDPDIKTSDFVEDYKHRKKANK